jgi:pimeloyl-ACP methyl ester carboxylesterase
LSTAATTGWRERRIVAAGISVVVFETGSTAIDARTLVLVHGLGHWTQAAWDVLVPVLDPRLRIVAFDLPGFGASDKPDARYDTPFFGQVVASILDQTVPATFVLCGHSLGGYIAANYAAAHRDRVERLVLIAPAGFLRAARFIYALLGSQLARWFFTRRPGRKFVDRTLSQSVVDPASIPPAIRDTAFAYATQFEVRRSFAAVYTGAIQDFREAPAVHGRLRAWKGPTLIIWGRHDHYIPIKALKTALTVYPQADVVICENSGHLPMVEEAPLVADAFQRFLAGSV